VNCVYILPEIVDIQIDKNRQNDDCNTKGKLPCDNHFDAVGSVPF
jgi:hypothetical protein